DIAASFRRMMHADALERRKFGGIFVDLLPGSASVLSLESPTLPKEHSAWGRVSPLESQKRRQAGLERRLSGGEARSALSAWERASSARPSPASQRVTLRITRPLLTGVLPAVKGVKPR